MPGNNENNSNSNDPTKIITLNNLANYTDYIERKGVDITYAAYQQLTPEQKAGKTFYITDYPEDTEIDAYEVVYDNTSSSLQADDVQEAIDELKELIDQGGGGGGTDTTYTLSVGTGADADKIVLTPSTGNPDKVTVPYAINAGAVNSHTVATDVPADAVFTDTTYSNATTTTAGLMSAADKITVDGLGTASTKNVATSGDASSTEVVMGNDSRLTDARNAADVYSWAKAENKPTYTASEVGAIATIAKGANNGVAELDSTGKVPSSQLPSYVDDVLEYDSTSYFPLTGETGKIYVAKDTNKTYRWSGSDYVEISESLALGETSSTAYAGNKGKANADAIIAIKDGSTIDSFGDVETALALKQNITDSTLQTTSNTIPGAINELKSGLIDVDVALDVPANTGKNRLLLTLSDIKSANTSGTWAGNVYTVSDCTFTVNTDTDGNVVSITAANAATVPSYVLLNIPLPHDNNNYKFNGGASSNYDMFIWDKSTNARAKKWDGTTNSATSTGSTFNEIKNVSDHNLLLECRIATNTPAGSGTFYPMVCPADITDTTFAPYIQSVESRIENVESGLIDVNTALSVPANSGKNLVDATTFDSYTSDKGITVAPNGTGGIAVSGTNSGTGATGVLLMKSGYTIALKAGVTYRFSGNWSGVTQGSTTIRMDLRPANTLDVLASEGNGGIGTYTPSEDINVRVYVRVAGSYAIPSNVTMYPVITTLADTSYAPYIPSVESRIEGLESGYDAIKNAIVYDKTVIPTGVSSVDITDSDQSFTALLTVTIPDGANNPSYHVGILVRQGTALALTVLKETNDMQLTASLSGNVITIGFSALNRYGGGVTIVKLI